MRCDVGRGEHPEGCSEMRVCGRKARGVRARRSKSKLQAKPTSRLIISTRLVCLRSTTSPIINCRVRCCNTHPSTSDSGESTGTRRPAPPVPRAPASRTPRVRPVQLRLARPPAYTLLHSEPVRKPRLHNQRSAHRARRQCALAPGAGLHRAQLTACTPHSEKVLVHVRDGRKLIGILRSYDQYGEQRSRESHPAQR